AERRLMRSAHDSSDGGLAVTFAECCFDTGGIGAEMAIEPASASPDEGTNRAAALFGESASRVLVSADVDAVSRVLERAAEAGVPARVVGRTGASRLRIAVAGQLAIDVSIDEAERGWSTSAERSSQRRAAGSWTNS